MEYGLYIHLPYCRSICPYCDFVKAPLHRAEPTRLLDALEREGAMAREREALRQLINPHQSHTPLPELIGRVNRNLRGWSNYFKLGYPRNAFRDLNHFVQCRLGKHLRRRSQRGWRARRGLNLSAHLKHMGLMAL